MSFHEVCACYVLVFQFNDLLIDCLSCRCTERRIWTRPSRSWCSACTCTTRDRRRRQVPRFDGVVAMESCGSTGRCPNEKAGFGSMFLAQAIPLQKEVATRMALDHVCLEFLTSCATRVWTWSTRKPSRWPCAIQDMDASAERSRDGMVCICFTSYIASLGPSALYN